MSAIWGFIDFSGATGTDEIKRINDIMRTGYKDCKIDRYGDYVAENICMGCGIQYFTPEAKAEILPIIDEDRGVFFTADAIIDNRIELLNKLGINEDDGSIPDARILFDMFDKYGEDCLNDLLGVYAFVYYDSMKGKCYIVNDVLGYRAIQYSFENGKLYFSTLSKPISKALGNPGINEQWFADFLALDNIAYCLDFESTPYEKVKRLKPAFCHIFERDKVTKKRYWNVVPSTMKLKDDEEYKKLFIKTYSEAVDRLVRNDKLTMLLSGGLDSTSIVCMLAASSKAQKVKLRTFTSIPCKDFGNEKGEYGIADESDEVIKTRKFLNRRGYDFEPEFVDLAGVNTWDDRKAEEKALEMPYKSLLNILWMKHALKESYKYGARIALMGGFGNCTVSLDVGNKYLYELIEKHKYITFFKECSALKRIYKTRKKQHLKNVITVIKNVYKQDNEPDISLENSLIMPKMVQKYNIAERALNNAKEYSGTYRSIERTKQLMLNEIVFYNYTEIETRESLDTGVIYRDPTADKRIIELCAALPVECYAQNGISRRLVREYLKEYMPENSQNQLYFGEQSADLAKRVSMDGDRIYTEMKNIFEKHRGSKIVDADRAIKESERLKEKGADAFVFDICRLAYTAMALEVMDDIDNLK